MYRNLLIMTPGFPSDEGDTTCVPAVQQFLICYLRQFPATKITVISLQYPFTKATYQWRGVTVHAIAGRNRGGVQKAATIARAIKRAVLENTRNRFDYVLSLWYTEAALAGKLFSSFTGLHHIVWMQGQDALKRNKYPEWTRLNGSNIAVISPFQKAVLQREQGIVAGAVVPNGINQSIFPELKTTGRTIDLLAVGSLIPLKQYELFISLVKELKEDGFFNIRAVLVGGGQQEAALKKQSADAGIDDLVVFTGSIPHENVLELMNNASVFVHPSCYEGCSTVMLEAAYSGCYVLGFVPPGDEPSDRMMICSNYEEMKEKCRELLLQQLHHQRVEYSNMNQTALQINALLEKKQISAAGETATGNTMTNKVTI